MQSVPEVLNPDRQRCSGHLLLALPGLEMCSGSEAGSYLRPVDFVYHSTLGLRVIKKTKFRGSDLQA